MHRWVDTSGDAPTDTGPPEHACDASVPWASVAAGRELFCGVHADGCAECWGDEPVRDTGSWWDTGHRFSDYGQTRPPDETFVRVSVERNPLSSFDNDNACGVTVEGALWCWGRRPFSTEGDYVDLRMGAWDTCALTADGDVECQGYADFPGYVKAFATDLWVDAAVRLGGNLWIELDDEEVADPGAPPYVALDVVRPERGASASIELCAIRADGGDVECWDPSTVGAVSPVFDAVPVGTFTAVCLTADDHACALDEAGYPTCWGAGPMGEPAEPLQQLSCGYADACGVTLDGRARCWGACDHGECEVPGG